MGSLQLAVAAQAFLLVLGSGARDAGPPPAQPPLRASRVVITGEQLRAVQTALVHFEKVLKSRKESGDKVLQRSSTLSAWEIESMARTTSSTRGEWVESTTRISPPPRPGTRPRAPTPCA